MVRDPSWKPGGPAANQRWGNGLAKGADGSLLISTSVEGGQPVSTEIVSAESTGYGVYEATYEVAGGLTSMRDMHPNLVWGVFTFDWEDEVPGYQEIDIVEDSRWSGYHDMVGTYTYYPGDEATAKQLPRRPWTADGRGATVRMSWSPGRVLWETWESHLTEEQARATPVGQGGYFHGELTEGVPVPKSQRVHVNLWAFRGQGGWESIPATTMRLNNFRFTPA